MSKANHDTPNRRAVIIGGATLATAAAALAAVPVIAAAAPAAQVAGPNPQLVALADRTLALRDAYNASDADDDDDALYAEFWATWEAVRDFTPHSLADIAEKIRVAKPIFEGSDTEDFCDMVVADVERLNGGAS